MPRQQVALQPFSAFIRGQEDVIDIPANKTREEKAKGNLKVGGPLFL
jgi:hypothetical protein